MKTKLLLKLLLCILLACVTAFSFTACGKEKDTDDSDITNNSNSGYSQGLSYVYNSDRTGYVVSGLGTNNDKILSIPETYNSLPVTGLSEDFLNSNIEDEYVEKIVFSKNIKINEDEGDFCCLHCIFKNLNAVEISQDNPYYKSVDGVVYTKDGKTLLFYPTQKNNTTFIVPQGVEIIDGSLYGGNAYLQELTLPNGLIQLSSCAFMGYSSLTKVVLPNTLEDIRESVFDGCSLLETINFNGTIQEWNSIEKLDDWRGGNWICEAPITSIICSDGEISIA